MKPIAKPPSQAATINLTPMIDVIFQLIIFYLCVTQFEKVDQLEPASLPKAGSAASDKNSKKSERRLVAQVAPDGAIRVDGKVVNLAEVERLVTARGKDAGPAGVDLRIRADKAVEFDRVRPLLELCAKLGIRKPSIVVAPGVKPDA